MEEIWEKKLVDGLVKAGNDNALLSGEGAREQAMTNLAEPIAEAIKNGGGGVHWIGSFTVAEINALENPEKGGIYGVKDGGVIFNKDGSRIEVSANDALVWNGEKWASFIDIDLEGYAKKEDVAAAVASAVASEATLRAAGDDNNAKAIRANAESIERHIADKTNPHGVTPEQIGAAKSTDLSGYVKKSGDTMTGRLTVQNAGGDQTKAAEGAIVAKMTAAANKTGVSTNGSVFAGDLDNTNSQFVGVRRKTESGAKVGARFQIYRRDASNNGTAAFMQVDYTSTATVKSIFEFGHNYGTKEDNWGTMTFDDVTKNVAYKEDYDTALNDSSVSAPQTKAVKAAIESGIRKEADDRALYDSQLRESIEALEEKAEEFVTGEEVSEAIAAEADSRIQEDIAINARIDMIPQTDWNETDEGSMAYLANHPTPISDIDIEALFS